MDQFIHILNGSSTERYGVAVTGSPAHPVGLALALSRLGAHVSRRFAERVAALDLTPSDAATLRALGRAGGVSQTELAARLGVAPSRIVALLDSLEGRGHIRREPSEVDRRRHVVTLTDSGREALAKLRPVATAHEAEILGDLTDDEKATLAALLARLTATAGIGDEGHPSIG
jgi:DNA-binding MarR family transcriptional regulator